MALSWIRQKGRFLGIVPSVFDPLKMDERPIDNCVHILYINIYTVDKQLMYSFEQ